ncbi:ribonuclease H-like domain-containing protein [Tanacetum coccineum]|uniref:Ribonuclease H-like domain-containing protein n=1 Tax=Tanacetum coccineum TaxID=301880 RepID=A0ABQ5GHW9_9ASTR
MMCLFNNSPPLGISKDQFEGFSDSNDDSTSIDDDSFSIEDINYVEASPPDSTSSLIELVELLSRKIVPDSMGIEILGFLKYLLMAEYRGVANAVAETCWLHNLLRELHTLLSSATLVYCNNVSDVYLSCNPVQHQCMKHIEIYIHLVWDLVDDGHVCVLHVPSRYPFTDIFTKGLPSALFEDFRTSLSARCPPAPTAREC